MSYVHIPYDSLSTLIHQFQHFHVSAFAQDNNKAPNFVVIHPKDYHGVYGGIVHNSVLEASASRDYLSEPLDEDSSLVWWNATRPRFLGDRNALAVDGYVAVTPGIYTQLRRNAMRRSSAARSSYYGSRARSIKSRSSAYSDSV